MRRDEERRVKDIRDAALAEDCAEVLRIACGLLHEPMPDVARSARRAASVPARGLGVAPAPPPSPRPLRPQPKPRRQQDTDAIQQYRDAWPMCQVLGCSKPSEVHHIINRSQGGPDHERNLLALCGGPEGHHRGRDGWHTLGPAPFLQRFHARLTAAVRRKVLTALGVDARPRQSVTS